MKSRGDGGTAGPAPLGPLIEALAPLIDAIAEAVVRKLEERREMDRLAQAVLQRVEELSADDPTWRADADSPAGEGGGPSREELYALIVAALEETPPAAEPRQYQVPSESQISE